MTTNPGCELCKGKGWFYGGERGEAMEDCPDCRPNPAAKFAPFHKIVTGLLEVKRLIADLDTLEPELKRLHKTSMNNHELIETSHECGCFHCLYTFAPTDVVKWTDRGRTALCPKCGIDSVLATVPDLTILTAMHLRWFSMIEGVDFALRQEGKEPEYFYTTFRR